MKLIAFTGPMGAGKSTAIQRLKDTHLEKKIELVKFAAPLYDAQEFLYRRISEVYSRPPTFVKDRKLLQWLGTEWGRSISPTLWVDLWKREVGYIRDNYSNAVVVCDDCRFPNEGEAVKEFGGVVVQITTTKNNERIDTKSGIQNHASENGLDKNYLDYVIHNDYSLEEFHNALDEVFKNVL
jgi:dephospho-CoA kinase